jgi:hypothetical protein
LRKLARSRLRGSGRNTALGTAALVHKSKLRFIHVGHLRGEDRHAFFAYASKVKRSVIIDAERDRQTHEKRHRPRTHQV